MDSINFEAEDVKSVIFDNGTPIVDSVTGSRHPTEATFTFYDQRTPVSVGFVAWTDAIQAIRVKTEDEFVCDNQRLVPKALPQEYFRLSDYESDSPFKRAQTVTVTPSGRTFKTEIDGSLDRPGALTWKDLRTLMSPYFFDARATAPKEETVYTRVDQGVINNALRKRRTIKAPSQSLSSQGREAGSSRVTGDGTSDRMSNTGDDSV